jgi:hypothetical protein
LRTVWHEPAEAHKLDAVMQSADLYVGKVPAWLCHHISRHRTGRSRARPQVTIACYGTAPRWSQRSTGGRSFRTRQRLFGPGPEGLPARRPRGCDTFEPAVPVSSGFGALLASVGVQYSPGSPNLEILVGIGPSVLPDRAVAPGHSPGYLKRRTFTHESLI